MTLTIMGFQKSLPVTFSRLPFPSASITSQGFPVFQQTLTNGAVGVFLSWMENMVLKPDLSNLIKRKLRDFIVLSSIGDHSRFRRPLSLSVNVGITFARTAQKFPHSK